MAELCCACLSRDRKLFALDKPKYVTLFGAETIMKFESVCWECAANFRRTHKFWIKIHKAQEILKTKIKDSITPLTHLKQSNLHLFDICCEKHIKNSEPKYIDTIYTIKTDCIIENIKSECTNDENLQKNELIVPIDVDKTSVDACLEIDETCIKNEPEFDDEYSDSEIPELTVSTIEPVPELDIEPVKLKKGKINNCKRKDSIQEKERKSKSKKAKVDYQESSRKRKREKLAVSKDNYIVIEMTEEEMLAKREADRQSDRYKNKVKYRCELCISGFYHKEMYEKHLRIRHSEKAGKYKCDICHIRFPSASAHREHVSAHYRRYRCAACPFAGHSLNEMVAHDATSHALKRFQCRLCLEEFPLRSRLRFHRETTHEAPVKCESCGKMFRTRDSLRVHIKQMHNFAPITPCTVCGARVRNLKSHLRVHSAAPEAAYCAECDKRFTSVASYRSHLKYSAPHRAPDTVLSHECGACGARFVNAVGLKKHAMRRHSNVRPHKCDRCGKGFEEHCKLKQHILHAHEGVEKAKDKICHICGRGFSTKLTLSNHIRVHTGEKPFRCTLCAAAFSQKSSLTTHTRGVHLKIKPRPGTRSA